MSARGTNFLHQWLVDNVPNLAASDIISVAKATERLFCDADSKALAEIVEDNGSVYEAVMDAIAHYHDTGLVE